LGAAKIAGSSVLLSVTEHLYAGLSVGVTAVREVVAEGRRAGAGADLLGPGGDAAARP